MTGFRFFSSPLNRRELSRLARHHRNATRSALTSFLPYTSALAFPHLLAPIFQVAFVHFFGADNTSEVYSKFGYANTPE
jgi:hypothetical protein